MSETEPDENLTSENKQRRNSEEIEATIEGCAKKVEIETSKCSLAEKDVQGSPTEIESNQVNQKNYDEDIATTIVETTNEDVTKVSQDKITTTTETVTITPTEIVATTTPSETATVTATAAATAAATATTTPRAIATTTTPTEANESNVTQTVPSEPPEATKISETTENNQISEDAKANEPEATKISDTTENRQIAQDANASESASGIERIAEQNDKKTGTIETASIENNSTTETSTTTTTTTTTRDPSDEYAEHITYTDDGNAIYTDPKTDHKYKWSAKENNWLYWMSGEKLTGNSSAGSTNDNPYENEHYKWCSKKNQWLPKAQSIEATSAATLSASQTETEHYKWDATKNAWIPKLQTQQAAAASSAKPTQPDAITYGIDKDGQRIYTDKDGVVFFWDVEKNAWFPKIDDDFMARYQMNYGFIDNTSASEEERKLKEQAEEKHKELELQEMVKEARAATEATAAGVGSSCLAAAGVKRKVTQEPPSWFDLNPEQNTKVYVSNLPLDITLDEFTEIMSKCGMIMRDPKTQQHKLKLYTEADGQIKGDGLCDYIKVESVELALKILDEYEVRGQKIRVQRAQFQMRGEYNPALKPKRKKKDKEKLQKMKEKLFDWRPEKLRGERTKNEKVVILKNLFTPELFEKEVQLILDYQNDLREECSKCGTVRKVVIYDLHPEGIAQVNMASPEEADLVIQMMQGRYFGKRQLTAEHWDGKTKYKIAETDTGVKSRLNNWDEFLETEEEKKPASATPEATIIKADDAAA